MNEQAIRELEQMYMMLSEQKKKAIDEAIKALQAQADKELLCDSCYRKIAGCQAKFHNPHPIDHCIEYKPIKSQADGEYINRILKRMWAWRSKNTQSIDKVAMEMILRDELPSVAIPTSPCDLCVYNDYPSDAYKPCTTCKAQSKD